MSAILTDTQARIADEWMKHRDLREAINLLYPLHSALAVVLEAAADMPKWKVEAEYWRRAHGETLAGSIRHGERMNAVMLAGLIGGKELAAEVSRGFDEPAAQPSQGD